MQIELTDAMIQQLVKEEVEARVIRFFEEDTTKYLIREYIDQAIKSQINSINIYEMASNKAEELTTKDILNKVSERISRDIAEAYADRYC